MRDCIICFHRGYIGTDEPCLSCSFYPEHPSFKEDVRLTTTKLDVFLPELKEWPKERLTRNLVRKLLGKETK